MQKYRSLAALVALVLIAGPSYSAPLADRVEVLEVGLPLIVDANDTTVGIVVGGSKTIANVLMEIDPDVYAIKVERDEIRVDSGLSAVFESSDCTGQAYGSTSAIFDDSLSAHIGFVAAPGKTLYEGDREETPITIQLGSVLPSTGCTTTSGPLEVITVGVVADLEVMFTAPFDLILNVPD